MCTHTKCEFMGFCSNMEDKANSSILLDWNTHCQMQHQLLLSIHPPALIVPAVPAEYFLLVATASLVVSIRSITQRWGVLMRLPGEAVQTLQNLNLLMFSLSKDGWPGIKKWISETEGGIREEREAGLLNVSIWDGKRSEEKSPSVEVMQG